ncbi:MAG: hypothetical protein AB2L14_36945 [Candidatus Xenobiia bacterium LiM19]
MEEALSAKYREYLEKEDSGHCGQWQEALLFFKGRAEAGEDISPAVHAIKKAYLDSRNVDIMACAADALTAHFLNCGAFDELSGLIRRREFGAYITEAMCRSAERGAVAPGSVFLLVESLAFSWLTRYKAKDAIVHYIGSDAERMKAVLAIMSEKAWLRGQIPFLMREPLSAGKKPPSHVIAAGVPVLALLLGGGKHRDDASDSLRWLAEDGVDISAALPVLEKALACESPAVRMNAAFCIAFDCLAGREDDPSGVDRLLSHGNPEIRAGAGRACGAVLISWRQHLKPLASRIARMLCDTISAIRLDAFQILEKAVREGLDPEPGLDAVAYLLQNIEQKESHILLYLVSLAGNSRDRARILLDVAAGLKLHDGGNLRKLTTCCREICAGEYIAPCPICRYIPRDGSYSCEYDIPVEVLKLVPEEPVRNGGLRRCHRCGSHYAIEFSEEWESPTEGMGCAVTITVRRLNPAEALCVLKGDGLEELKKDYAGLIQRAERSIAHPETYLREDAACALTAHYLQNGEWERLAGILHNRDGKVRLAALLTAGRFDPAKLEHLTGAIQILTRDRDVEISKLAAVTLCRYFSLTRDTDRLKALAGNPDPAVRKTVFDVICSDPATDMRPFTDIIHESLTHKDEDLRYHARNAMVEAIQRGVEVPRNLELLVGILSHEKKRIRENARAALKDVMSKVDTRRVVLTLTALLAGGNVTGRHALRVLNDAAQSRDISDAFPVLIKMARDTEDPGREDAAFLMQTVLKSSYCDTEKMEILLGQFAEMLFDRSEPMRRCAVDTFSLMIRKRRDISRAIPAILQMLASSRAGSTERQFACDVSRYLIRKKEWDSITALLKAGSDTGGAAGEALADWAGRGRDISPAIPALAEALSSASSDVRKGAADALAKWAERGVEKAEQVLMEIGKPGMRGEDTERLVQKLKAACVAMPGESQL